MGWTTFGAGGSDKARGFCNKPTPTNGYIKAGAGFDKTTEGPLLDEVLRGFPSVAAATAALAKTRHDASSCRTFTSDGALTRLAPLSFPQLGDGTFAVQIRQQPAVIDEAYVIVGNVIVQVGAGGLLAEPDLAVRYAKLAVKRLERDEALWVR